MKNQIIEIVRFKHNGMYEDFYTVYYKNGMKRKYKINGKMSVKHFNFMMNAKCEKIENMIGRHVGDRYIVKDGENNGRN